MKIPLIATLLTFGAVSHSHAADRTSATASIRCGETLFLARTKFRNDIAVAQTLEAEIKREPGKKKVDLRQTKVFFPYELGKIKALSSFVTGWQCRRTPAGHVIVLAYACHQDLREDLPDTLCSQTLEWERYISASGDLLDAGYSFDDPRYVGLRARLGYHDNPPDQATIEDPFTQIY